MQALDKFYDPSPEHQTTSSEVKPEGENRDDLDSKHQFYSISDILANYSSSSYFAGNEPTLLSSIKAAHSAAVSQNDSTEQISDDSTAIKGQLKISIPLLDTINGDEQLFSPSDLPPLTSSASSQFEATTPITPGGSKRNRSKTHTPRPSNSFILYRREKHVEIMAQYKGGKSLNNNVISKIVANMWRSESTDVKAHFAAKAEAEKQAHLLKYPDYKYRPRKSISKSNSISKSATSPTRKSSKSSDDEQKKSDKQKSQGQMESKRSDQSSSQVAPMMSVIPNLYAGQSYAFPYGFPHHPQMAHYPIHVAHHLGMVEAGEPGSGPLHAFEFGLTGYENTDFFQQSPLLATEYGHPWPEQPVVWETDFGLVGENQKQA